MKKLSAIFSTVSIITAVAITPATSIYAVESPNNDAGQALEIAPPVLTLTANPGDTVNAQINLRDVSNTPLIVTSAVNDFSAKGEGGEPDIDLEGTEPSPYSLKPWMQPLPQLNLKSKEIQKLPVVIKVPQNAAPGGYWGVVRFTATPPDMNSTGVSLSASLGSLIFLRVNGDAKESMEVVDFYASEPGKDKSAGLFEQTPIDFVLRIKNTGTVHEQPVSQIRVVDMFGREAASVNMNLEGRNVLPGSVRKFTSAMDRGALGTSTLFGKYTATITSTFGASKQTVTKSIEFWVVPYRMIIVIIVGLILLFFIIRTLLRNYRRKITRSARTSRR